MTRYDTEVLGLGIFNTDNKDFIIICIRSNI